MIMIGPPGAGKTMVAKRLPSILPPLSLQEALETTKVHSVAGQLGKDSTLMTKRPYRAPHHTISDVALVGGGASQLGIKLMGALSGVAFAFVVGAIVWLALKFLVSIHHLRTTAIGSLHLLAASMVSFLI